MSVKQELIDLKELRKVIESKLEDVISSLDDLNSKRDPILQKVETLSLRSSQLAKELLKESQTELEKFDNEISHKKQEKAEFEKQLTEIHGKIIERECNFDLYLSEQVPQMVSSFFEYVSSNKKEIGSKIQKTFKIKSQTEKYEDRYGTYYMPTGIIGIYDDVTKKFITLSTNFYFTQRLYEIKHDNYWERIYSVNTKWYNNFLKTFTSAILVGLKKDFPYGDSFKLTIEDSSFTLELV